MFPRPSRTVLLALMVALVGSDLLADGTKSHESLTADVIIAGGSTAALATAFASAESGAKTILVEPTDWIGGQLTASGVPPVDEAWHKIVDPQSGAVLVDVAKIARDPRNMSPILRDILQQIQNPGRGWVSRFCYQPKIILQDHLQPIANGLSDKLVILREAVIKQVETKSRRIVACEVIQRFPRTSVGGYDRLPSQDLDDWYDPEPSPRFDKKQIRIRADEATVFVDATEWGELLALSGSDYLQGVERAEGSLESMDRCGQSTVFGFAQRLHDRPTADTVSFTTVPGLGAWKV